MKSVLLLGIMLLMAGCTLQQQPAAPSSCEAYCPTLPHSQCSGTWTIAGNYPNCVCDYVCANATAPLQPANNTPPAQPPPANTTPAPTPVTPNTTNVSPPKPLLPPTNVTIDALYNSSMDKLHSDFYQAFPGSFQETDYNVMVTPGNTTPGSIVLSGPSSTIRFNGIAIDSLRASGLIVFNNTQDGTLHSRGIAIFIGNTTIMTGNDSFTTYSVDYPDFIPLKLQNCYTYSTQYDGDPQGDWLLTYYFTCAGTQYR